MKMENVDAIYKVESNFVDELNLSRNGMVKEIKPEFDIIKLCLQKHSINTVHELLSRGYENSLPVDCNEKEIIEKFFANILKERQENSDSKITKNTFLSEDQKIAEVAAYMFMKEMPYEFTKSYNSISDEYDFLLNPNDFDSKKLEIEWIFSYSNDLINKIRDNENQRKMILTAINNKGLSYEKEKMARLFQIYIMLNNTD
ncbi:MAG: hypothetical protein PHW34_13205 [Hespellia sp.]|nr:hypothetical protein [Hespellia sp.]